MIYTIGETVYDIIFKNMQPIGAKAGGAMLNTAISLGRLQTPVCFISEIGNDPIGNYIMQFLIDNNIQNQHIEQFNGNTPIALAILDENNNATYTFHRHYPNERLNMPMPELTANDYLLFGSSFSFNKAIRTKLHTLLLQSKKNNACLMYDPNFRAAHQHELPQAMPLIRENISLANIVRASDEDCKAIFNTTTPEDAYAEIQSNGCSVLIYTASKHAVHLFTPTLHRIFEVPNISTISTIGAGDTFNAGILYMLQKQACPLDQLNNIQWEKAIKTAIACATQVCQSLDNYISVEFANEIQYK